MTRGASNSSKADAARLSGSEQRLQRLLLMVPWVMQNPGVSAAEVCDRFGITQQQLDRDLKLIFVCGLDPYTPDRLMFAEVDEGEVVITDAEYFERPLHLTRGEALSVLAAGRAASQIPGVSTPDALESALSKLERALDMEGPAGALEISLNSDPLRLRDRVAEAIRSRRQLRIRYFSATSQKELEREIDPYQLVAHDGRWYIAAWCHKADGQRLFRLDRVAEVSETGKETESVGLEESPVPEPGPGDHAFPAVLCMKRGPLEQFGDYFRIESAVPEGDDRVRVEIRAASVEWLVELLVRMGSDVQVVEPEFVKDAVRERAARILAAYGSAAGGRGDEDAGAR